MKEFSKSWGGTSAVYKQDGEMVAVKEFYKSTKNDEAFDRGQKKIFENENAILKTLEHPLIIKLYKCSIENGVCKLFLELGERDLLYRFFCEDPPPCKLSLRMGYAMEVAQALTYLHGVEVIHLDVNLANILLVSNGEHIKLTDFGRSVKLKPGQEVYEPGILFGTPGYEPPEALQYRSYSRKSDVYSFGVVLHALRFLKRPQKETPFGIPRNFPQENRDFLFPFWDKDPKKRPDIKVATDILQMEKLFTIK